MYLKVCFYSNFKKWLSNIPISNWKQKYLYFFKESNMKVAPFYIAYNEMSRLIITYHEFVDAIVYSLYLSFMMFSHLQNSKFM